eukprot:Em0099g3a
MHNNHSSKHQWSVECQSINTGSVKSIALECSVCMEEFSDSGHSVPRSLACGHSFCTGCLERLLVASPNHSGVACPKCCILTPLSTQSVELVPKNFGVLELLSCPPSIALHGSSYLEPSSPTRREGGVFCADHGDHLSSYCLTDKKLVCSSCLLYGTHKQHECLLVNEAASQRRSILNSLTPDLQTHKATLESALVNVDRLNEQIQSAAGGLVDTVDKKFNELARCIEARRVKLKIEIMERAQIRVHALADQSEKLREFINKTSIASASCAELLSASDVDVLRGFDLTDAKIEAAYTNPVSTVPIAYDDLVCTFSQDTESEVIGLVERFGAISAEVGTVQNVVCQAYHDGFRISWEGHGFVDNEGISYHVQVAMDNEEYATIYRGGETKFTWKTELKFVTVYKFRVQVRTTEGVGCWSSPIESMKAPPAGNGCALYGDRDSGPGKVQVGEKKLAVGAIDCTKESLRRIDWQFGKEAIGTVGASVFQLKENRTRTSAFKDLGVAFEDVVVTSLLPAVSLRDKIEINVRVTTMDAELEFAIQQSTTGKQLFDQVKKKKRNGVNKTMGVFDLNGLKYGWDIEFILMFTWEGRARLWFRTYARRLLFSSSFVSSSFPEDVQDELIQEITQKLFYLQVREAILTEEIYCPPERLSCYASYAVQAKYGDYKQDFTSLVSLPTIDYCLRGHGTAQADQGAGEERIATWYQEHKTILREDAMMEYLKIAQDLEMYGGQLLPDQEQEGPDLWLGVDCPGSECDFVFFAPRLRINKRVLALCMGNHELYMRRRKPDTIEVQQMKAQAPRREARQADGELQREKQAREDAEKEKKELADRVRKIEMEARRTHEELQRQEESAKLLEDKVRRAEAEARELELKRMQAEEEKKKMGATDQNLLFVPVIGHESEGKWRRRHSRWPWKQKRRLKLQLIFKEELEAAKQKHEELEKAVQLLRTTLLQKEHRMRGRRMGRLLADTDFNMERL